MVIIGAGGHAKELLDILIRQNETDGLYFFDNTENGRLKDHLFGFPILRSFEEIKALPDSQKQITIGIGDVSIRKKFRDMAISNGLAVSSIVSELTTISTLDVHLGPLLNIMDFVVIGPSVSIGDGVLLNKHVVVHHDSSVGDFSVISPGVMLLGNVHIGKMCMIGAGSIVLPKVKVGNNVTIGAGAVVTKDIPDNVLVKGIPAK